MIRLGFKSLVVGLAVAASTVAHVPLVQAQEIPGTTAWRDALQDAFFDDSKTFYDNQSTLRQLRTVLGTGRSIFRRGNYAEINVERDAERVNQVYQQMLQEQVASDPTIRVVDLPNPFETSLLVQPSLYSNQSAGTEFVYERSPIR